MTSITFHSHCKRETSVAFYSHCKIHIMSEFARPSYAESAKPIRRCPSPTFVMACAYFLSPPQVSQIWKNISGILLLYADSRLHTGIHVVYINVTVSCRVPVILANVKVRELLEFTTGECTQLVHVTLLRSRIQG